MNRLQSLRAEREFCVTLNRSEAIDPEQGHPHDPLRAPGLHGRGPGRAGAPRRDQRPRTARTTAAPTGAGASTRTAWSAASAWRDGAGSGGPVSHSALYEGRIRHRRFAVRKREFRYRIAMAYVDLDELPTLLGGRLVALAPRARALPPPRLLRRSGRAAGSTRCARWSPSASGARPRARSACSPTCARSATASTRSASTTASPRTASTLEAVVAEVTNTPWGERHAYVRGAARLDKALHVSPFMPMDQRYTVRAPAPGETLVGAHREPPGRAASRSTPRSA